MIDGVMCCGAFFVAYMSKVHAYDMCVNVCSLC